MDRGLGFYRCAQSSLPCLAFRFFFNLEAKILSAEAEPDRGLTQATDRQGPLVSCPSTQKMARHDVVTPVTTATVLHAWDKSINQLTDHIAAGQINQSGN